MRYRSRLTAGANALLATGTTRNEQVHATLNSDFRQIIHVSQQMLGAQLRTWGAMELALAHRALGGRTTVRVKHADMRPFVVASTQLFGKDSWSAHVESAQAHFEGIGPRAPTRRMPRRGPTEHQEHVFRCIRDAKRPGGRAAIFDLSTKKRCT